MQAFGEPPSPESWRWLSFARVALRRMQHGTAGTARLAEDRKSVGDAAERRRLEDRLAGRTARGQERLPLGKLAVFALLSVADWYLTWQLVVAGDGQIYEVNPLANVWLRSFGWVGLTIFKGLDMVFVAVLALYVARHRPRAGARLLLFACSANALVVAYSSCLALQADSLRATKTDEIRCAEQKNRCLDREMERERRYKALLAQLGADLTSQRLRLGEAVDRLAQTDSSHDPRWMWHLHRAYPGRSDAECLALQLVHFTLADLTHNPATGRSLAQQLEAQYVATYGREVSFDLTDETSYCRPPPSAQPIGSAEWPGSTVASDRICRTIPVRLSVQ
jgi:hypothetical protein